MAGTIRVTLIGIMACLLFGCRQTADTALDTPSQIDADGQAIKPLEAQTLTGLAACGVAAPVFGGEILGSLVLAIGPDVWRAWPDGKIERIYSDPSGASGGAMYLGGIGPVASPDGSAIARIENRGIMVRRSNDPSESYVAVPGATEGETAADFALYLTGWSPSARFLMFAVAPPDRESDDGIVLLPDSLYAYYLYDAETNQIRRAGIDGDVLDWAPNGDILFMRQEPGSPRWDPHSPRWLVLLDPVTLEARDLLELSEEPSQLSLRRDGQYAALRRADPDSEPTAVRIEVLDLRDGGTCPVTPYGEWATYQRPRFSPSGHALVYVMGDPQTVVVADSGEIYRCGQRCDARWISDDVLLVDEFVAAGGTRLSVVDVGTGQIRGSIITGSR